MPINDDIVLLKKFDFFSKMTTEQLRLLIFGAERRSFKAGDAIFHEGEPAECAYVIHSGIVSLYRQKNDNIYPIDIINKPALLNELALITEITCSTTALAQSNCIALQISRTIFLRLINEFPEITQYIYDYVNERIRKLANDVKRLPNLQND